MDFALASNTVQEIVDILDSATSDDWDAPHGQGPDDRMRLVLARALDAFAESERKSTLHEVWYALKASLPAGPVQEIMNKVIDEISERKSSKPGGW